MASLSTDCNESGVTEKSCILEYNKNSIPIVTNPSRINNLSLWFFCVSCFSICKKFLRRSIYAY